MTGLSAMTAANLVRAVHETKREPFADHFDADIARDFHVSVRCALLHEARTKNGWRIHARDERQWPIDPQNRIMFRNDFQTALLKFVATYREKLVHIQDLQFAFIRKFDALCE